MEEQSLTSIILESIGFIIVGAFLAWRESKRRPSTPVPVQSNPINRAYSYEELSNELTKKNEAVKLMTLTLSLILLSIYGRY